MTATASDARTRLRRWRGSDRDVQVEPLSPRLELARIALILVFVLSVSLLLELLVVSVLQQRSSQQAAYDRYRSELARGTAPIGPIQPRPATSNDDEVEDVGVPVGAPIAFLEIPAIGLRQVVVQGTTPGALFSGPGHRRDSPLPGQEGTAVILGRSAAFGGPFRDLEGLEEGDLIIATTGQGEFEYEVVGLRRDGDPTPPPLEVGDGRLLLATAAGRSFLPDGVLRVDAEIVGEPYAAISPQFTNDSLPASEQMMASDTSTIWALVLWMQALILLTLGSVWAWHRWGRAKAWVVFLPPLLLVGLLTADEAARLLPNLM